MHDCLIIGGGVIGLSIAWELSRHGLDVTVVEQGEFGREASWAGAGMLPPGNLELARTPEALLRSASHRLWPALSAELREVTGIDNGFRRNGGLELRFAGPGDELDDEIRSWRESGVELQRLAPAEALELEPELGPGLSAAYLLPEFGQVRNPRHLKALVAGCLQRGVTLVAGTPVLELARSGSQVVRAVTPTGHISAREYIVSGGAWSERLLAGVGSAPWIRPMRGQIALLNQLPNPLQRVVNLGHRYLVPRGDGRILIGSTEEDVGYDRRTTAGGIAGLLELASGVVPCLGQATIERVWAGLRPRSIDGLPYLGRMPEVDNLIIAAGHFRAGLQLSAITGVLVGEIVRGVPASIPLAGFRPDRAGGE